MPHQCVHCSKIIEIESKEILKGCDSCGGKFFFYIRDEQVEQIKKSMETPIPEFDTVDKKKVEADVRRILKIEDETKPVILDLESIRVLKPGQFEIDTSAEQVNVRNLFLQPMNMEEILLIM